MNTLTIRNVRYREIRFPGFWVSEVGGFYRRKGQVLHPIRPFLKANTPFVQFNDLDGREHRLSLARLVHLAFLGPVPPGAHVRHFPDQNPMNCHFLNLTTRPLDSLRAFKPCYVCKGPMPSYRTNPYCTDCNRIYERKMRRRALLKKKNKLRSRIAYRRKRKLRRQQQVVAYATKINHFA